MKVLHLIGGGDIGGAKVHVLSLARALSSRIPVKLVSYRHGSFSEDALRMGIDVKIISTGRFLLDVRETIRLIRQDSYDILHCHGAKGNIIGYLCKRKTGICLVSTIHSDYRLDYLHNVFKTFTLGLINALVLRKMDALIPVTLHFRKLLIQRRFNPNRVYSIHNGMDFPKEVPRYTREYLSEKFGIPLDKNTVLVGILARLYPVKSIETLIEAARFIKKENPNIKFLIGGEGEDYRKLDRLVKKYRLEDTCYFLGWLKDPHELMSIIDISVLTSISEGLPYSLLEGALFRKATIATAVGGIPDLINHGVSGYLLQPRDIPSLVSHILDLSKDVLKRERFGNALHAMAIRDFSMERMVSVQMDIYEDMMSWILRKGRTYDIILSGYYGFGNIGDDALLYSILFNLKSIEKDIRILILSRNPVETASLLGVDSISRFNLFEIISTMKKSDLFIYGGGTLIQESTSTRSLLYYLGTMYLAKRLGLGTMLYANGVEPLKKAFNRLVTRKVVNQIDLITLREMKSRELLRALKIDKPVIEVTADPAVTTYPCPGKRVEEIFQNDAIPPGRKYLGISIREWQGYEKRFLPIIARYADHMSTVHGYVPIFIPMQWRFVDDVALSRAVMSRMEQPSYILSEYYSAEEIMGVIGRLDLLVGMRLHSLIFAACCQTPLIGIVYEPKVAWFMEYIRLPRLLAGHVSDFTLETLLDLTSCVIETAPDIRVHLEKETLLLRQKAMDNARLAIDLKNRARGIPHEN